MSRLTVRVHPGARRNAVIRYVDCILYLELAAPATDGRANDALIELLANELRLPRRGVAIIHGHRARNKLVDLEISEESLASWLQDHKT